MHSHSPPGSIPRTRSLADRHDAARDTPLHVLPLRPGATRRKRAGRLGGGRICALSVGWNGMPTRTAVSCAISLSHADLTSLTRPRQAARWRRYRPLRCRLRAARAGVRRRRGARPVDRPPPHAVCD